MPLKFFRGLLPLLAASLCWTGSAVADQEAGTVASKPAPTESEQAAQADYRIGAGDQLNVYVWNHPELTLTVPVRPDGKISTPLIESLPAAGKTPLQLAREMETALAEYVRAPKVNVIVTGFVGVGLLRLPLLWIAVPLAVLSVYLAWREDPAERRA